MSQQLRNSSPASPGVRRALFSSQVQMSLTSSGHGQSRIARYARPALVMGAASGGTEQAASRQPCRLAAFPESGRARDKALPRLIRLRSARARAWARTSSSMVTVVRMDMHQMTQTLGRRQHDVPLHLRALDALASAQFSPGGLVGQRAGARRSWGPSQLHGGWGMRGLEALGRGSQAARSLGHMAWPADRPEVRRSIQVLS